MADAGEVHLLGRSDEVEHLVDVADRAAGHGVQMVLVSGEAGIGKTTLCAAVLDQLSANGWNVHIGHCIEYANRSMPFGPVASLLRSVVFDDPTRTKAIVGRRGDDLAGLLPELQVESGDRSSLAGDIDRLFDAIAACLQEASLDRPAALLIEDIHWADAETRNLIASLLRNLGSARILLVVTERTGTVERGHPLNTWLAERRRWPNVHSLTLEGLSRDDLAAQAHRLLERPPQAELVDELAARTGGNPYFSEELLFAYRAGNSELPSSLADFLATRLHGLGRDEQQVLRAMAVAGGSVSHQMLSAVLSELPINDLVRSLFEAAVIVVDGDDYSFGHSLLREAVLRDILPFERVDLHRRTAEAITADPERGGSLGDLSNLALHWAGAGDLGRSLDAALNAANAAAAVAAHESAVELALQALDAWSGARDPEAITGLTRDHLLLLAADWLARCLRGDEAVTLINDALTGWAKDLPAGRRALLLATLAPIHWDLGNPPEARRALAAAEEVLPDEVSPEAAQVYDRLSRQALSDGQIEPARKWAERAITVASREGPKVVLVEAMAKKALTLGVAGDLPDGQSLAAGARQLAVDAGLVAQVANTYRIEMLNINFNHGPSDACLAAIRQGLEYAEQNCGPRWRERFRFDLCFGYVEAGQFLRAEPFFEALLASELEPLSQMTVLQSVGLFALGTDDLERARSFVTEATEIADRYQSAQETGFQFRLRAELARREGRLDDAMAFIEEALRLQLSGDNLSYTRDSILEKIRIARACLEQGRAEASRLVDEARVLVDDFHGSSPANAAMRSMMILELAAADGAVDPDQAASTIALFGETGFLLEAAEARLLQLRGMIQSGGDKGLIETKVRELETLATQNGMAWILVRLAEVAERAGVNVAVPERAPKPEAAPVPELPHFLTAREVEVMSLLAEGLTNKAIGERLFVSPRTVSTHISNLLGKLGVSNRGEAAAAYHRLGLSEAL